MTGEPARGPRGEGVGTEEIPGTETGKEELEGNRRVASGRAQLPKGWWLWRSVWWHLVVFSELPKLAEMKDLLLLSAAQICVRSSVTKGRCGPAWQDRCPSSYCQNIHLQSTFYKQDQKSRSGCGEPSFLSPTCFFTALLALVPSPRSRTHPLGSLHPHSSYEGFNTPRTRKSQWQN